MMDYSRILQQISQTLAEADKNYAKFASDDAATTNIENQPTTHPSGRADSGTQEPVEGAHSQFLDQEIKKQDAGNVSGEGKAVDQMTNQDKESDAPVPPDEGVMETKGKADDENYENKETSHPAKTKDEKTASAQAILERVDHLAKLGNDAITQLWQFCNFDPRQLELGKQAGVQLHPAHHASVIQQLQALDKVAADSLVVSKIATSLAAGRAVGERVAGVLDWLVKLAEDEEDDDDDDDEHETSAEEKKVEEEAQKAEAAGADDVAAQAADAAIAQAAAEAAEPSEEEIAQLVAALDSQGMTPEKLASGTDLESDRLQKWASSPQGRRKLAHLLKIFQLSKGHLKEQAARSR